MTLSKKEKRIERKRISQELLMLEVRKERGEEIDADRFEALGRKMTELTGERTEERKERAGALITRAHVKAAEENGIKLKTLQHRVYTDGMLPEEALQLKVREKVERTPLEESNITIEKYLYRKQKDISDVLIAYEFNISRQNLNLFKRKNKLMAEDLKQLRQSPPIDPHKQIQYDRYGMRIFPKEYINLAASNGIKRQTFYNRVCNHNYSYYEAATKPVKNQKKETGKKNA